MKKIVVLIIEDEAPIRDMIRFALEPEGFKVIEADNSRMAEKQIAHFNPDIILLDWMLPGTSGIDFAKQLKRKAQTEDTPIILLTSKAEEENKIRGLQISDDYITKPFSPRELIARIKTVIRRGPLLTPGCIIHIRDLCLDTNSHQVKINNKIIELAPIEYKLLYFFVTHQHRVYSRDHLLSQVWGNENYVHERTVDVQIRRLRSRLKPYGYDTHIKTIHGDGYQFVAKTPDIQI